MTEAKPPIVEIHNLSKSYRRGSQIIPVLQDISFDIAEGEFLALMGPSGSGKSTLLNLIAGIDKADTGTIRVGGVDITALSEAELAAWRAANVGFIFQFYNLMPVLTAFENVELPLLLTGLSRKRAARARRNGASRVVSLTDRMDHYPSQLSGGQQQRVAIARAIVTDPAILVADEPTGDLDRVSAEEILELMDRLVHEFGKTIIMVTHDPRAAEKAHLVRHLEKGELTTEETFLLTAAHWLRPAAALTRTNMFFLKLIIRNAFRHKLRSFLTIVGVAIAILAFGLLRTLVGLWYLGVETPQPPVS